MGVEMQAEHVTRFETELRKNLEGIEHSLAEHGATPGEVSVPVDDDEGFADSGHATMERSERIGQIDQLLGSQAEIKRALERIADGKYGTCESCDVEIPMERLEARPATTLCVECKNLV
ncbi:MAG TPA: TraR/DksA C4-type zinc finger protein [Actinomycetota bacterium]|nr:TraR/DksA C4-type zinc finger protein [Actinomycetota bacterium]